MGLDTNHLWTNWNWTLFISLFSVFYIAISYVTSSNMDNLDFWDKR